MKIALLGLVSALLLLACGEESGTPAASVAESPAPTEAPPTAEPTATLEPPTPQPTQAPPTAGPQAAAASPPTAVPPTAIPPTQAPSLATVSNPNGVCIEAWTPGQVIENLLIGPCGDGGIDIRAANVTVRNVTIFNSATSIRVYETSGALIEGNRFRDPINPDEGYVQQVSIDQASNVIVRNNTMTCGAGCEQEDAVGVFQSQDVLIEGNSISGGNSRSGCGILLDHGAFRVTVRRNVIRNQANCGVGVGSGTDHLVEANDVASYGNVGIYVWNQYGGACRRITVRNNVVQGSNPWWNGGNCTELAVTGNNFDDD
jgi:hypothetical protein